MGSASARPSRSGSDSTRTGQRRPVGRITGDDPSRKARVVLASRMIRSGDGYRLAKVDAHGNIRVATFNVRNGLAFDCLNSWPFRRHAVARTIRGLDADLVALQEAYGFQLRFLMRQLDGYDVTGAGRNGRWGEHTAVLTRRHTVEVSEHWTRWFGETPERPGTRLAGARFARIATTVVAQVRGGVSLRFTSTHLDERSPERREQSAAQLIAWASEHDGPHIVAGDLNATPDAPMFAAFAAAGFRRVEPAGAGGTFHRFGGQRDGRQLDHILVRGELDVVDPRVVYGEPGERLASDHWPVVTELAVSYRSAPRPPSTVST